MNDLWFGEECFIETLSAFLFIGHRLTDPLRDAVVALHGSAKPMARILLTLLKRVVPQGRGTVANDKEDSARRGAKLPDSMIPSQTHHASMLPPFTFRRGT